MKMVWAHVIIYLLLHQTAAASSLLNNSSTQLYPWCRALQQLSQESILSQLDDYSTCHAASWNQSVDCCLWDGVGCDAVNASRRRVVKLDLSDCELTSIPSNSSLFTLTHLHTLNLAHNYFFVGQFTSLAPIPPQIGRLNRLMHLDLSESNFGGRIPYELYHLSNLESLDLSDNYGLTGDIKMLLGNMTKIREVFLSSVVFNTSQLPSNMSSFLTHLDLQDCGLVSTLPVTIFEKPDLKELYLDSNYGLVGSLPSLNSSNVRAIEDLGLSMTSISGRLPESIGFMTNLTYLMLNSCKFWGPIPESIGNMTELEMMYLTQNNFTGQLPSTISSLWKLRWLDISHNHLGGIIPSLANMSLLYFFHASWNELTGSVPSIHHTLIYLDLSFNKLTGNIRNLDCQCSSIDLSYNQLGIVFESFYNLSQLKYLYASHNARSEHASQIVNPKTLDSLLELDLSSCGIEEIPDMVRNLSSLKILKLSSNRIQGPTPSWFNSISLQNLAFVHLSTNHLTSAEHLPSQLSYLNLESNSLHETFPLSVCNMSGLSILILSNNKLSGQIPECIGILSLEILDLRRNQLTGKIPETIGSEVGLNILQLNGNRLEGPLPRSLANCTSLTVLDLGNNMIIDSFPIWLEAALLELKILILKSNRFRGSIFSDDSFGKLQILDLSHNNFSGILPDRFFSRLQAMKSLDQVDRTDPYLGHTSDDNYVYSVNLYVKGTSVEFVKVLKIFTIIDLSNNDLQGPIPESIAHLYSLRLLNCPTTISRDAFHQQSET